MELGHTDPLYAVPTYSIQKYEIAEEESVKSVYTTKNKIFPDLNKPLPEQNTQ